MRIRRLTKKLTLRSGKGKSRRFFRRLFCSRLGSRSNSEKDRFSHSVSNFRCVFFEPYKLLAVAQKPKIMPIFCLVIFASRQTDQRLPVTPPPPIEIYRVHALLSTLSLRIFAWVQEDLRRNSKGPSQNKRVLRAGGRYFACIVWARAELSRGLKTVITK